MPQSDGRIYLSRYGGGTGALPSLCCGILCHKRPGLDIISVGPDMKDIHTPREKLSIGSTKRTYELVCATLAVLAK